MAMTAAEAAALEQSLEANPDNVEARETLIIFYDQAGKATWEEKLAGIRRHSLWRIAHLPETDLWIPNISKRYDPEGYAQAKQLWLEHTSRPDVDSEDAGESRGISELVRQAARRGAADPRSADGARGSVVRPAVELYAKAIVGSVDPRYGATDRCRAGSPRSLSKRGASSRRPAIRGCWRLRDIALMRWSPRARQTLCTDAPSVSNAPLRWIRRMPAHAPALADVQLLRALEGNPGPAAQPPARLTPSTISATPRTAAISALPLEDRLFYLPGAAESAYMRAEYIDYTAREKPEAEQAEARRERAEEGFARARPVRERCARARANQSTGRAGQRRDLSRRDGAGRARAEGRRPQGGRRAHAHRRRRADVRSGPLRVALRAAANAWLSTCSGQASGRRWPRYLEKSAERMLIERDRLLKDAAQMRAGVMPLSYQYAEARR